MGIKPVWQQDVVTSLEDVGITTTYIESLEYDLISVGTGSVVMNMISLENTYRSEGLILLQEKYQLKNISLVNLWEDIWKTRKAQVIGRISSILGLNNRIHARKTKIIAITQQQANDFLNDNHLQASAKANYKFGLSLDDQVIAVGCFSNLRYMKGRSPGYRSAELIRFASLTGYTVIGGFSKLLQHFIKNYKPDDVMSYADRDWSLGKAYEQSGFKLAEVTSPAEIWVKQDTLVRYFSHRLPAEFFNKESGSIMGDEYVKVFNTGNLKYILYL
nr:hypothetical protein [Pedobacter panaciterrae]